jgi:hypothetical protein
VTLTHQRLLEILSYDEASGHFLWIKPTSNRVKIGSKAGSVNLDGYVQIKIDGKLQYGHRLALFYTSGEMPPDMVDHINGVRDDNRLCNLRHVHVVMNNENRRSAQSNNKLGVLGVSPSRGRFKAQIQVGGKNFSLGRFPSIETAQRVYLEARRTLHEGNTL